MAEQVCSYYVACGVVVNYLPYGQKNFGSFLCSWQVTTVVNFLQTYCYVGRGMGGEIYLKDVQKLFK